MNIDSEPSKTKRDQRQSAEAAETLSENVSLNQHEQAHGGQAKSGVEESEALAPTLDVGSETGEHTMIYLCGRSLNFGIARTPIEFFLSVCKQVGATANQYSEWLGPPQFVALLLGVVLLIMLLVGIRTVPESIEQSAGGTTPEQHAREHLRSLIHDELAADLLQETKELTELQTRVRPAAQLESSAATGGSSRATDTVPEELSVARALQAKGKFVESIPYYEAALKSLPDSIELRIEVIKVYLATKLRYKARLLCYRTLKKPLTESQIDALWKLLGQCQTN